jgi:glyoxylase-like metal-dependent hydrolase (beta-lactamase superfamily II)/8-oxo-dGTP pyrophosphatase MutT (NUDIX family)
LSAAHVTPLDARAAASLLLLRDGPAGLEVLMMRRAEREGDLRSGVAVFPGGVLDPRDREAHAFCVGSDDATMSRRLGLPEGGLDYAVAALRECFEEVGLLLVDAPFNAPLAESGRTRLQAGQASAAELCAALGVKLDLRELVYYSHWLTPQSVPKRFDTRFFVVPAPAGQLARADMGEALETLWLTPRAALDPARGLKLLPVTQRTLQELARHADVAGAMAAARAVKEIPLTLPRVGQTAHGRRVVLPDEWPYAELARLDPEGHGECFADLRPGRAVRLSPHVLRVTAPNPGVMTGPGTNTYLVGAGDAWTVIDPGPDDAGHVQAILDSAPGRIVRILVSHTHLDHSPAARSLARATGAPVLGRRPLYPGGQDASFAPTQELSQGDRLSLADGVTLRVIHTPGHASNHLCYLLEEERTLFTGDHVMQGSTVVINPPDGDMSDYLAALRALLDEPLDWLAPGHGFLVADPPAVLQALIRHRLAREEKVLQALRRQSPAPLDGLLSEVYADVPAGLHPVARRSLLAHLLKLQVDGAARDDGAAWSIT